MSIPARIEIQEFRDLSAFTVFFRIVTKGDGALLIVAPISPSRFSCRGCIGLAKSADPRHGGAALLK
jgi:hypothetical protein